VLEFILFLVDYLAYTDIDLKLSLAVISLPLGMIPGFLFGIANELMELLFDTEEGVLPLMRPTLPYLVGSKVFGRSWLMV
jgi:hypothetical protein